MKCHRLLLGALVLASLDAGASEATLYVRSKDTRLLKTASPGAVVLKTLQPGAEVKWLGANPRDPKLQRVTVDGVSGFVARIHLSPVKPTVELEGAAKGVFAPTGYSRTASPAAVKIAEQLAQVEELNTRDASAEAIQVHLRASGLAPR